MLSTTQSSLLPRLTDNFGQPATWKSKTGAECSLWTTNLPFEIIAPHDGGNDVHIRRTLEDRRHLRTVPVILLADSDDPTKTRVVGPHEPYIVRKLNTTSVLNLIDHARQLNTRPAAAFLEREFLRLYKSVLPGIRVKDLLTPHYIRTRLRQYSSNKEYLEAATENVKRLTQTTTWRTVFGQLGYQIERLEPRGYILRYQDLPVAVVHPMNSTDDFDRMNENGELPDGLVINDCKASGAHWGILVSGLRFRIFQANPNFGSATARYIEIEARELGSQDRLYLGLFAPESLKANGRLTNWASDARDFGEELRKGLEERLRTIALPNLATGIGRYLELTQGTDLKDRDKLQEIEQAVLTLVFRFMFLLHVEARDYLPMNSDDYTSRSARRIAEESKKAQWEYDSNSTRLWDSLRTLTRMIRHGDKQIGVPAYNGSLFAAGKFPGAELLENIEISDSYFAPAIRSIAFDLDKSDAGLDYAGLQVGHLGAIYEALLSLKLIRANEDLTYDSKRDVLRPMRVGEQAEIVASELFYLTEKGGRKAAGVYYTREEFVQHLLRNSLIPALDEHLNRIEAQAKTDPSKAASDLFDFSIVDPAMGSGHFLTTALDMMADRIELFLADIGGLPDIRKQLAELRKGQAANLASVEDVDLLRRLILKRSIYGVDISPMAVEVANVTLWLASFVPGLALSYLGSNLKCGDALIGVAGQEVVDTSQVPLFAEQASKAMQRAVDIHAKLTTIPDVTPEEVYQSQELDNELQKATAGLHRAYHLWTANPLGVGSARDLLQLHAESIISGQYLRSPGVSKIVKQSQLKAEQYRFFHWSLEFPHVFHDSQPGFDVVVGNPPWNKVKFERTNFIALNDPGFLAVRSTRERDRREAVLLRDNPSLVNEINSQVSKAADIRNFFKRENGYPMQGVGDKDLFKLFCERYVTLASRNGFIGVVLPRSVFINDGTVEFRNWLFRENSVERIDVAVNNRLWAFPIHPQYSIALVTAKIENKTIDRTFLSSGPSTNLDDFNSASSSLGVTMSVDILGDSCVVPLTPQKAHADVLAKIRDGIEFGDLNSQCLSGVRTQDGTTDLTLYTELHSAQQRALFNVSEDLSDTEVWGGRSFNRIDPHGVQLAGHGVWDDIFGFIQRKRLNAHKFKRMFCTETLQDPSKHPVWRSRVAFRRSTRATDSHTVISCLVPPETPLVDTCAYIVFADPNAKNEARVLGIINSLLFDWAARRYVEMVLSHFLFNQLTFPPPENTPWQQIGKLAARLSCVDERFADFAAEAGVEYGPQTDAERDDMRAEIDALVARAYDLTEDELRFVFTDFTERAVTPAYRQLVLEKFERL